MFLKQDPNRDRSVYLWKSLFTKANGRRTSSSHRRHPDMDAQLSINRSSRSVEYAYPIYDVISSWGFCSRKIGWKWDSESLQLRQRIDMIWMD